MRTWNFKENCPIPSPACAGVIKVSIGVASSAASAVTSRIFSCGGRSTTSPSARCFCFFSCLIRYRIVCRHVVPYNSFIWLKAPVASTAVGSQSRVNSKHLQGLQKRFQDQEIMRLLWPRQPSVPAKNRRAETILAKPERERSIRLLWQVPEQAEQAIMLLRHAQVAILE